MQQVQSGAPYPLAVALQQPGAVIIIGEWHSAATFAPNRNPMLRLATKIEDAVNVFIAAEGDALFGLRAEVIVDATAEKIILALVPNGSSEPEAEFSLLVGQFHKILAVGDEDARATFPSRPTQSANAKLFSLLSLVAHWNFKIALPGQLIESDRTFFGSAGDIEYLKKSAVELDDQPVEAVLEKFDVCLRQRKGGRCLVLENIKGAENLPSLELPMTCLNIVSDALHTGDRIVVKFRRRVHRLGGAPAPAVGSDAWKHTVSNGDGSATPERKRRGRKRQRQRGLDLDG